MYSINACLYSYHLCLSYFCIFFSFLSFLSCSTSSSFIPSRPCPSFTVHSHHFLYYLPWWDLPFLPLNCFWLLIGVLPRLPTGLPTAQTLPLLWMCLLHHSPFTPQLFLAPYRCPFETAHWPADCSNTTIALNVFATPLPIPRQNCLSCFLPLFVFHNPYLDKD